jgi:pyridoxamine 5'-phosphate oxidase
MKTEPGSLAAIRTEYSGAPIDPELAAPNPFEQFGRWFSEALEADLPQPNAMTLATIGLDGRPRARVVLLKDTSEQGFVFYTNYQSAKGVELEANPDASLCFFWEPLHRQVRLVGSVRRTSDDVADRYFESRPHQSQIGAWASPQSEEIPSREWLEDRERVLSKQLGDHVDRPPHWGGFVLAPDEFEFWQGRSARLHDRVAYALRDGTWTRRRLAP